MLILDNCVLSAIIYGDTFTNTSNSPLPGFVLTSTSLHEYPFSETYFNERNTTIEITSRYRETDIHLSNYVNRYIYILIKQAHFKNIFCQLK